MFVLFYFIACRAILTMIQNKGGFMWKFSSSSSLKPGKTISAYCFSAKTYLDMRKGLLRIWRSKTFFVQWTFYDFFIFKQNFPLKFTLAKVKIFLWLKYFIIIISSVYSIFCIYFSYQKDFFLLNKFSLYMIHINRLWCRMLLTLKVNSKKKKLIFIV